jgi:hypothetical protein
VKDGDGKVSMDARRFRALVATYGADRERWPSAERQSAESFLRGSSEAPKWLEVEQQLDALLDEAGPVEPSAALLRRVAEIPLRHPAPERVLAPLGRLRNWFTILVAAAVAGAVVGVVTPDLAPGIEPDSGGEDLSSLDWAADLSEELAP